MVGAVSRIIEFSLGKPNELSVVIKVSGISVYADETFGER